MSKFLKKMNKLASLALPQINQHINSTFNERKASSARKNFGEWQAITALVDGTHIPVKVDSDVKGEHSWHSFKLKCDAVNQLVGTDFDFIIFYISPSHPAGTHNDQELWNMYGDEYMAKLTPEDASVADGPFQRL